MWRVLIDLILPRLCHCCGRELSDKEQGICRVCMTNLPVTSYHLRKDNPVEQRLAGRLKFERASSWLFYSAESVIARLIHDFKYHGFASLARDLGSAMARDISRSGWLDGIDFIMGVPLHWRKRLSRGYCQTLEIAAGIGRVIGADVANDLIACRYHKSQTGMTHDERRSNVKGIFRLRNPERYSGKTILLVDDVCTTGSTIAAAGAAISESCADSRIVILTLATIY